MGTLQQLIMRAQDDEPDAMLSIIEMFRPAIQKFARLKNYDEDVKSEMTLSLIEVVHAIRLDKLNISSDGILISYISKALKHSYIHLSQRSERVRDSEMTCDDTHQFLIDAYDPNDKNFSDEVVTFAFLKQTLSPREYLCVTKIVIEGYSATELANLLGVSKQAINQCKRRALQKLRALMT